MPKGSRVLMADDDKMLIDMYKERLELAGYAVTICRNGEEALAKVREIKPDIVLLDIMMPKINGYETLAAIKSDPQTKDIPVIMLSALMRDFNREKAVEAGADDYLIKSEAMPADVITKIEQVLSKYGKGATPAPGMNAPNIPAPSATPPVSAGIPAPAPATIETAPQTTPQPQVNPDLSPVAPPVVPPATPAPAALTAVPTPPLEIMHNENPAPSTTPPATPPEKIVFEPATPETAPTASAETPAATSGTIETQPMGMSSPAPSQAEKPEAEKPKEKEEEVPVVKLNQNLPPPPTIEQPQPAPSLPWETAGNQALENPPKPPKSPASIALIVILAILLTALVNDVVIYYFFFMNK